MQFPRLRENSPFCDSDEEVFVGPVTSKELEKASKLKRRTQVYFPRFDWKQSQTSSKGSASNAYQEADNLSEELKKHSSELAKDNSHSALNDLSKSFKESVMINSEGGLNQKSGESCFPMSEGDLKRFAAPASMKVAHNMSVQSDSSLDKKSECTKETFSDDSLDKLTVMPAETNSMSSDDSLDQNPIAASHTFSIHSDDSLEGNVHVAILDQDNRPSRDYFDNSRFQNKHTPLEPVSIHSDGSSSPDSRNFVSCYSQSGGSDDFKSQLSLDKAQTCSNQSDSTDVHNSQDLLNVACINSLQSLNSERSESQCMESATAFPVPSESSIDNNSFKSFDTAQSHGMATLGVDNEDLKTTLYNTYVSNAEANRRSDGKSDPMSLNVASNPEILSDAVTVDKDGGYLSILSEAALYHASQMRQRPSSEIQQSLEDRFHEFGVNDDDLEKQQLSESIMYTTGRDSYSLSTASAYFPPRCLGKDGERRTFFSPSITEVNEHEQDHDHQESNNGMATLHLQSADVTEEETYPDSSVPCRRMSSSNQEFLKEADDEISCSNVMSRNFASSNLTSEESPQTSDSPILDVTCDVIDQEGNGNGSTEMHTAQSDIDSSSSASSPSGKMNDTLEEYEMMMRYGVDYIMGNIKKKNEGDKSENLQAEIQQGEIMDTSSSSHHEIKDYIEPLYPSAKEKTKSAESQLSHSPSQKFGNKADGLCRTPLSTPKKQATPNKPLPMRSCPASGPSIKSSSNSVPHSAIPRVMRPKYTPTKQPCTPTHQMMQKMTPSTTPGSSAKSMAFKKPSIPVSASKLPKYASPAASLRNNMPKTNQKILGNIQSPVSAYIHNTPSPVLVRNVKAKVKDVGCWENEMHARALWRAGEGVSSIPKPQVNNIENLNPNIGCALPAVKYTRAPCIKLDEPGTSYMPKVCDKITKLLETPCPQVIKHEGRLNIKSGSPQLTAKVQAVAACPDDSMVGVGPSSGDISVCVSKAAVRTDTLRLRSPLKLNTKF